MILPISKILVILAVVCSLVATLMAANAVSGGNPFEWAFASLTFFFAASLLP